LSALLTPSSCKEVSELVDESLTRSASEKNIDCFWKKNRFRTSIMWIWACEEKKFWAKEILIFFGHWELFVQCVAKKMSFTKLPTMIWEYRKTQVCIVSQKHSFIVKQRERKKKRKRRMYDDSLWTVADDDDDDESRDGLKRTSIWSLSWISTMASSKSAI